jgi:hypothetical protein
MRLSEVTPANLTSAGVAGLCFADAEGSRRARAASALGCGMGRFLYLVQCLVHLRSGAWIVACDVVVNGIEVGKRCARGFSAIRRLLASAYPRRPTTASLLPLRRLEYLPSFEIET